MTGIGRVTQQMVAKSAYDSVGRGLTDLARTREQLSSGKSLLRPSDDPIATNSAIRLRDGISRQSAFQRQAEDGTGWLTAADQTITTVYDNLAKAKELGLQAANDGAMSVIGRESLAAQIDQIRDGLINTANAQYIDRPIFGGITSGAQAYDSDGNYVGIDQPVNRTISDGISVRVDVSGPSVFGPDDDSVFAHLTALANSIRTGDSAALETGLGALNGDVDRVSVAHAHVGATQNRIEDAIQTAKDRQLALKTDMSNIVDLDYPKALIELQMQETNYQAALASTSRVLGQSLLDFLR